MASVVDRGEQAVHPGDAAVGQRGRVEAEAAEDGHALVGHGQVGRAGGDHEDARRPGRRRPERHGREARRSRRRSPGRAPSGRRRGGDRLDLRRRSARVSRTGPPGSVEQLGDDGRALLGRLARPVHGLGMPWRRSRWWSTRAKPRSAKGRRRSRAHGVVGRAARPRHVVEQLPERGLVHDLTILPQTVTPLCDHPVAYLGPAGTFTEEALLTQPDLAAAELRAARRPSPTVLDAVAGGEVDLGFVPIENAIEGTVNATLDGLVFDVDLLIQREVVLDIHLHLLARPGTELADIRRVCPSRMRWPSAGSTWPSTARAEQRGRQLDGRRGPASSASEAAPGRPPSRRGWPPSSTASRSWPRTSRTTPRTRPGSSWWPGRGCPRRPGTTGRASCASSGPTTRAACTGSWASSRHATSTSPSSSPGRPSRGSGDYCFVIDLDGPPRRRGRRRLPARPARRAGRA